MHMTSYDVIYFGTWHADAYNTMAYGVPILIN